MSRYPACSKPAFKVSSVQSCLSIRSFLRYQVLHLTISFRFQVLKGKSSSSHLNRPIPNRLAKEQRCLAFLGNSATFFIKCSSVRILCSRSASFTTITRISCAIARNIRRKFSAWLSVLLEKLNLESLVTPSTSCRTSDPNRCSNSQS